MIIHFDYDKNNCTILLSFVIFLFCTFYIVLNCTFSMLIILNMSSIHKKINVQIIQLSSRNNTLFVQILFEACTNLHS